MRVFSIARTHTKEKPCQCNYSISLELTPEEKPVSATVQVLNIARTHTKENPYQCEYHTCYCIRFFPQAWQGERDKVSSIWLSFIVNPSPWAPVLTLPFLPAFFFTYIFIFFLSPFFFFFWFPLNFLPPFFFLSKTWNSSPKGKNYSPAFGANNRRIDAPVSMWFEKRWLEFLSSTKKNHKFKFILFKKGVE